MSEGSGENLFLVKDGVLITPALAHSVLGGITRDTVMRLARERGIEVRECAIPRELLYLADEAFFTGTAVEITPIRSVDRITVGAGKRGPITETLQHAFFGLFYGQDRRQVGLARSRGHGSAARRGRRLRPRRSMARAPQTMFEKVWDAARGRRRDAPIRPRCCTSICT